MSDSKPDVSITKEHASSFTIDVPTIIESVRVKDELDTLRNKIDELVTAVNVIIRSQNIEYQNGGVDHLPPRGTVT